jgi:hypothetical protein
VGCGEDGESGNVANKKVEMWGNRERGNVGTAAFGCPAKAKPSAKANNQASDGARARSKGYKLKAKS